MNNNTRQIGAIEKYYNENIQPHLINYLVNKRKEYERQVPYVEITDTTLENKKILVNSDYIENKMVVDENGEFLKIKYSDISCIYITTMKKKIYDNKTLMIDTSKLNIFTKIIGVPIYSIWNLLIFSRRTLLLLISSLLFLYFLYYMMYIPLSLTVVISMILLTFHDSVPFLNGTKTLSNYSIIVELLNDNNRYELYRGHREETLYDIEKIRKTIEVNLTNYVKSTLY